MRVFKKRKSKKPPKLYDAIDRDDGTKLVFDKPLKLGQALSAKAREKR